MSVKTTKLSNSAKLLEAAEAEKDFTNAMKLYKDAITACDEGIDAKAEASDTAEITQGLYQHLLKAKADSLVLLLQNLDKEADPIKALNLVASDVEELVTNKVFDQAKPGNDFEATFKANLNVVLQNIFDIHHKSDPKGAEAHLDSAEGFLQSEIAKGADSGLDSKFIVDAYSVLIDERSLATKHDTAIAAFDYLKSQADLSTFDADNVKMIESWSAIEKLSADEDIKDVLTLVGDKAAQAQFIKDLGSMALTFRDDFRDVRDGKLAGDKDALADHYLHFFVNYQNHNLEFAKQVLNVLHGNYKAKEVDVDVALLDNLSLYDLADFSDVGMKA